MKRKAVIDQMTGGVVNVVLWDGVSIFRDAPGTYSIECDERTQIGDSYNALTQVWVKQCDAPKPPPPTADELAAIKVDSMDLLQFEHLFDLENRMRAQEGKQAITRAVYRQALIDRWKTLTAQ